MNIFIQDSVAIIGLFIMLIGVFAIMVIQFFRIRMFRKLFKELSAVYSRDKNLDYNSLVESIIQSKELYHAGSSLEVIEMISNYIKKIIAGSRVFIHIAPDKATAESIIHDGFKYSEDFHKSSEEISSNLSDLTYKLQIYRPYGKFVIILCIPKNLFTEPDGKIFTGEKDVLVEYGISEYNPGNEMMYTLPPRFVCGYADIENKKIVENKLFSIQK